MLLHIQVLSVGGVIIIETKSKNEAGENNRMKIK